MGRLIRLFAVAVAALLAGCATAPAPKEVAPEAPVAQETAPPVGEVEPTPAPEPEPVAEPVPEVPRLSPSGPPARQSVVPAVPQVAVSPLDLDAWPFGWVTDADQARRLGAPERFWSDHKPLWRQALDPATPAATAVRRLEALFRSANSPEEAYRAAWHLWLDYRGAALADDARTWLDRADALRPGPVTRLERAWDQAFRLGDLAGARALWGGSGGVTSSEDDRKARLLRQRLFLGTLDLTTAGADGYVSTLALDQDDLWAGTWNGAVVRWSLTTGALDLMLAPGATVAPIKQLTNTGWFLYAFQNQNLLRYSKVTGTWRTYPYPPGWTGLRVQGVVADGQESLWVAYLGQGLWHWDRGGWTLIDDGGGGPFLNALASDGQGGFWIGTKDRGLWSWKGGVWTPVAAESPAPVDISVIAAEPGGTRWAVGTWGEGTWILDQGRLRPESRAGEFVVGAAWTDSGPLWGTLDEGLITGAGADRRVLGPQDGLPPGGVSAVAVWGGRWIWGAAGQGVGWWSEYENPALLR